MTEDYQELQIKKAIPHSLIWATICIILPLSAVRAQELLLNSRVSSSLILINPGFVGDNYQNRLSVNYFYQTHPLGNLQSLHISNDFDIPKIHARSGIIISSDRIATSNQQHMMKGIFAYELKLNKKNSMIFSWEGGLGSTRFDGAKYFNRYVYTDALTPGNSPVASSAFGSLKAGCLISNPLFFVGLSSNITHPIIGNMDSYGLLYGDQYSFIIGFKIRGKGTTIIPTFSYDYRSSKLRVEENVTNYTLNCLDLNLNIYRKWYILGMGFRHITNIGNTFKFETGVKHSDYTLFCNLGITPYRLNNLNKTAACLQLCIEKNLKRNKRYHKPIYHDTSEYYNDRKLKVNRQFKDGVLIAEIEYFQNGEIKSEKNFENGKLDGFYAEYYENNDNTRIQGKYDQGIKIGNWYYWNSEGSCYRLERYDKGVLIDAQNKCD
jgi:hypothetical protein